MTRFARFAGLLFTGLFAGFLVGVLVLELSLRNFDRSVYTRVRLVELDSLDKLATATLLPALAATAVSTFRTFRTNTRWLAVAAPALLVFVLGLTIMVNLPINADQLGWNVQSPPADWSEVRDRWQIAHTVRTVAAVLAFGFLALTTVLPSRGASPQTVAESSRET
ncbi:anthrone oxygenase family protein [Nocardia sp. NPDC057668]|uniref:anthrone oxygenase family protein n=1 Tax=Nocardia sp. NPDC057668 TaxID=3346202 RepID=UPI00366E7570